MDFTNTCRACMQTNEKPLNWLFSDNLADIFMSCTLLKISEHDLLPQKICIPCSDHLQISYKFKLQCKTSEAAFLSYLNENVPTFVSESCSKTDSVIKEESEKSDDESINNEDLIKLKVKSKKNKKIKPLDVIDKNIPIKTCSICKKTFTYLTSFKKHQSTCRRFEETLNPMLCGLCDYQCDTDVKLNLHLDMHMDDEKLTCGKCEYIGVDWADFLCHRYAHQAKDSTMRLHCWKCNSLFLNVECLEFHIRHRHLNKPPGLCRICLKEFKNIKNLRAHKMMHTGVKPNQCNICEKRFLYKRSLVLHMRCHSDAKKYVCHACGATFKFRTGLTSHQFRLHSDVESAICNHCNKTFKNNRTLREHLLRVNSVKNFKCLDCGKMYRSQRELHVHSKWHSDAKPYRCNHCGKSYKSNNHLTNHLRQHTGERPYQCEICKNSFTTSSVLKKHIMIHSNDKKHSCKFCGKAFIEKSNLKSHLKTHKCNDDENQKRNESSKSVFF